MRWSYSYTVLVMALAANLAQVGTRVVISPLVPRLLTDFAVSRTLIGGLLTGMWALFALAHYPSGVLAERFGSRRVIVVALAATGLASGLLVVAPSFSLFAAAVLLLGSSAGLYFVVGTGFVADHFTTRTGQARGVTSRVRDEIPDISSKSRQCRCQPEELRGVTPRVRDEMSDLVSILDDTE